ncbi:hypothetical protein I2I05_11770 [Hymenobacter sp. BT683]|uniref:Uncharacterized protein n=1 Tax=Hymenobacter jeongseonensis TaxID=2791027 RepID=A0ABS0IJN7_9BACT|nr:hypothetical protein [Hymenobacter jeongseonensis]MBF9238073.1 hypothetical protein [Hymenobacter jeongseonensis]
MQVPPFYSPWRGLALRDVWHDNDACFVAKSIPPLHRLPGTGPTGRARCEYCALLTGAAVPTGFRKFWPRWARHR